MLSIKILNVKGFMNNFLIGNIFDKFLICEGTVKTFSSYIIDGNLNKNFYNDEEKENISNRSYSLWSEQKPLVFQIIKGNKKPLYFKFILCLSNQAIENLIFQNNLALNPSDVNGLFLNILYENNEIICTTGTSLKIFTMDKTLEQTWDEKIKRFFVKNELVFESL